MKRYAVACLFSTLIGVFIGSRWSQLPSMLPSLAAQERPRTAIREPLELLPQVRPLAPPDNQDLTPEERISVSVYEAVNRSVVNIRTESGRSDVFSLFEFSSEGAGSGSVLDTKGHILTNFHVVDDAREIEVTLHDGKNYDAKLIGKDEFGDIAVLKVEAPAASLIPVVFGDSRRLKVGQRVYAIGNPFGLERTLTTGIVSSVNRPLPVRNHRTIKSIQIDAAINPGNSGGPLLDTHGRLIGMNMAIATTTGQSAGVGFAIPVANIARVVPQLIERGRVIRPDAGITRVGETEQGLVVATMSPSGPAEKAGLRGFRIVRQRRKQGLFTYETQTIDRHAADVIVAINGEKIITADDFLAAIEAHAQGDEVAFTILREGREMQIRLRLTSTDS